MNWLPIDLQSYHNTIGQEKLFNSTELLLSFNFDGYKQFVEITKVLKIKILANKLSLSLIFFRCSFNCHLTEQSNY